MIADDTISFVKKDILIFGISVTVFLIIVLSLLPALAVCFFEGIKITLYYFAFIYVYLGMFI